MVDAPFILLHFFFFPKAMKLGDWQNQLTFNITISHRFRGIFHNSQFRPTWRGRRAAKRKCSCKATKLIKAKRVRLISNKIKWHTKPINITCEERQKHWTECYKWCQRRGTIIITCWCTNWPLDLKEVNLFIMVKKTKVVFP